MNAENQLKLNAIYLHLNNIQDKPYVKSYENALVILNNRIKVFEIAKKNYKKIKNIITLSLIKHIPKELVEIIQSYVYVEYDVTIEWSRIYKKKIISIINNMMYKNVISNFDDYIDNADVNYYEYHTFIFSWYKNNNIETLRHRKIVQVEISYINYTNMYYRNDLTEYDEYLLMDSHFCINCGNYTGIFRWNLEKDRELYQLENIPPEKTHSHKMFCKCVNIN
jgi:hypothetical protein